MSVIVQHYDNREISMGAEEITENNVQYWCRHTKELKYSQISKALKFIQYNCLRYVGDFDNPSFNSLRENYDHTKHIFICLPLNTYETHFAFGVNFSKAPFSADYNSSEYIIYKRPDGTFECNCQGYQSKKKRNEIIPNGANCSHILALFYMFKLKRFGNHEK